MNCSASDGARQPPLYGTATILTDCAKSPRSASAEILLFIVYGSAIIPSQIWTPRTENKESGTGRHAPAHTGESPLIENRDGNTNLPLIAAIVGVATIGGFMFGYDSGVINGTQEGLRSTFHLSEAWLGITVSALLPGCAVGAFLAGRLADVWGRRRVMVAAALLFILSALASGAAGSALMMIFARFAAGAGVGAASVLSPAYISEVTPASMRGRLSSVQQVMIIAGLTGAFLANYFLAYGAGKSTDAVLAGISGLALDVLDADHSGERVFPDPAVHPRKPALPGGARPHRGSANGVDALVRQRLGGGEGRGNSRLAGGGPHAAPERSDRPQVGPPARHRLGGHRACHFSATSGHQRRVLLRRGAVAGGGFQRSGFAEDQYLERHLVHCGLPAGDFSHRSHRPKAAAA